MHVCVCGCVHCCIACLFGEADPKGLSEIGCRGANPFSSDVSLHPSCKNHNLYLNDGIAQVTDRAGLP